VRWSGLQPATGALASALARVLKDRAGHPRAEAILHPNSPDNTPDRRSTRDLVSSGPTGRNSRTDYCNNQDRRNTGRHTNRSRIHVVRKSRHNLHESRARLRTRGQSTPDQSKLDQSPPNQSKPGPRAIRRSTHVRPRSSVRPKIHVPRPKIHVPRVPQPSHWSQEGSPEDPLPGPVISFS